MMATRFLVISKHLLDPRDAQAQQSMALVKSLAAIAERVDVVTGMFPKPSMEQLEGNVKLHAVPASWLSHRQRLWDKVERKVRRNLDACIPTAWVRRAAAVSSQLLAQRKYNALISLAMPMESHIAALRTHRTAPWIAYMSDPWPESCLPAPYSDFAIPVLNAFQKWIVSRVFLKADALAFSCQEGLDWIAGIYPSLDRAKSHVIPHVAAPAATLPAILPPEGRLLLVHAGALSRERVCLPLAEAIGRLPIDSKWQLKLVGKTHPNMLEAFAHAGAMDRVLVEEWKDKNETIETLKSAQALLLLEARMPHYPFLPSKLADYASTGKPIISVTGADSAAARFVRSTRAGLVTSHDADSILRALLDMEGSYENYSSLELAKLFNPSAVANAYAALAQSLNARTISNEACPFP